MIQIFNVTVTVNDSGQYAVRVKFQDFHSNAKKLKYIVTKHLDVEDKEPTATAKARQRTVKYQLQS